MHLAGTGGERERKAARAGKCASALWDGMVSGMRRIRELSLISWEEHAGTCKPFNDKPNGPFFVHSRLPYWQKCVSLNECGSLDTFNGSWKYSRLMDHATKSYLQIHKWTKNERDKFKCTQLWQEIFWKPIIIIFSEIRGIRIWGLAIIGFRWG